MRREIQKMQSTIDENIKKFRALCHREGCNDIHECPKKHPFCRELVNTRTVVFWAVAGVLEEIKKCSDVTDLEMSVAQLSILSCILDLCEEDYLKFVGPLESIENELRKIIRRLKKL